MHDGCTPKRPENVCKQHLSPPTGPVVRSPPLATANCEIRSRGVRRGARSRHDDRSRARRVGRRRGAGRACHHPARRGARALRRRGRARARPRGAPTGTPAGHMRTLRRANGSSRGRPSCVTPLAAPQARIARPAARPLRRRRGRSARGDPRRPSLDGCSRASTAWSARRAGTVPSRSRRGDRRGTLDAEHARAHPDAGRALQETPATGGCGDHTARLGDRSEAAATIVALARRQASRPLDAARVPSSVGGSSARLRGRTRRRPAVGDAAGTALPSDDAPAQPSEGTGRSSSTRSPTTSREDGERPARRCRRGRRRPDRDPARHARVRPGLRPGGRRRRRRRRSRATSSTSGCRAPPPRARGGGGPSRSPSTVSGRASASSLAIVAPCVRPRRSPLAAPAAAHATLRTRRSPHALRAPWLSLGRTAAFAVDLRTGAVLFAHNASRPVVPASNEKLPVAWAALTRLGPGFRFHTEVLGAGDARGATWRRRPLAEGPRRSDARSRRPRRARGHGAGARDHARHGLDPRRRVVLRHAAAARPGWKRVLRRRSRARRSPRSSSTAPAAGRRSRRRSSPPARFRAGARRRAASWSPGRPGLGTAPRRASARDRSLGRARADRPRR